MENIKAFAASLVIIGGVSYLMNYLITRFKLIQDQFLSWVVSIYLTYLILFSLLMGFLKQWISDKQLKVPSMLMKKWMPSVLAIVLFVPLIYTSIIVMVRYIVGMFTRNKSETFNFMISIAISVAISVFVVAKIPVGCQC